MNIEYVYTAEEVEGPRITPFLPKARCTTALQCTVMHFQQLQSTWNEKLSNLNPFQQNVIYMKAYVTNLTFH